MKKKVYFLFIIISLFLLFPFSKEVYNLEVIFFNIGQGDSSFIDVNHKQILIDGGPDNLVLRRLGKEMKFFDRTIDLIVISHYHSDHIIGLIDVMKRYKVKELVYFKDSPHSPLLDELLQIAREEGVRIWELDGISNVQLDDNCNLELISPLVLDIPFNENNSIISHLSCYHHTFLFSGDNEYRVEEELVRNKFKLQSDIFKASHHGSNTSNKEYFLKLIQPKVVVISVGANNKFHHPSSLVVDRFKKLGIKVFRTDVDGNVYFRY